MKKTGLFFVPAIIAALLACVITSCGDDGEYVKMPGQLNEAMIETLRTTKTPIAYNWSGYTSFYHKVDGDKWEEYDPPVWGCTFGRHVIELGYGPEWIYFNDGKVYCSLWSYYGINWRVVCGWDMWELKDIWEKYVDDTYPQQIYLCDDFQYNKKKKTLIVGGKEMGLISCDKLELKIVCTHDEYRTCDEYWPKNLPEDEKIIAFDDCKDAYRYIINCAREQYGDVVTIYTSLHPDEVWKEFNLNELEAKLETEQTFDW